MNIINLYELTFGVDDMKACTQHLIDYGLTPIGVSDAGGRFEAEDGTAIVLRLRNDPSLPPALETNSQLRKTTHGVADQAAVDAIAKELSKDRAVKTLSDGSIESVDDMGFAIGFAVAKNRVITTMTETINSPGSPNQRGMNVLAVDEEAPANPLKLSHVVYFVPDAKKAMAFYTDRLGFVCTDLLGGAPFLRPLGTADHHTLFLIQTPPFMKGIEHFTFHMNGPTAVMQAGYRFVKRGGDSFWGPGRHKMGSNWFWYFNSPLGCHIEYDADMDVHDDAWQARTMPMGADASQLFLFAHKEKWAPGGPPAGAAGAKQH